MLCRGLLGLLSYSVVSHTDEKVTNIVNLYRKEESTLGRFFGSESAYVTSSRN